MPRSSDRRLWRVSSHVLLGRCCARGQPVSSSEHYARTSFSVPESDRLEALFTGVGAPRAAEVVSGLSAVSSAAAVAQFQKSGFLVVEHAFQLSEVASALDGISAIARRRVPAFNARMDHPDLSELTADEQVAPAAAFYENRESMIYYEQHVPGNSLPLGQDRPIRKLNGFIAFEPRLAALADRAGRAAAALLSADTAMLFQDMALLKPASVGSEKPWHQDHA